MSILFTKFFSRRFKNIGHAVRNILHRCFVPSNISLHKTFGFVIMNCVKHSRRGFHGTKLDHFQAAFCVSPFFSTSMPFLHESHCLLWPLTSVQREEHSENSVSSFHYLCPATSSSGYRAGKDDRDSMEWNCLNLLSRLQLHRRRYNNPLPLCHRLNYRYYANESFMVL